MSCLRPALANGGTSSVMLLLQAPASPGSMTVNASVSALETDSAAANNSATATTTLYAPQPVAEIGVTQTPSTLDPAQGDPLSYILTVHNAGPANVAGAVVTDTWPVGLNAVTWTCAPSAGSSCTASGYGDLLDLVDLPAAGTITYSASGLLDPYFTGPLSNTVSAWATGVTDPVSGNNVAAATVFVHPEGPVIFNDGFESADTGRWSAQSPGL